LKLPISRRNFLKGSAILLGSLAIAKGGLKSDIFTFAEQNDKKIDKTAEIYTTCGICENHCAVKAYVKEGVLERLEGVPEDQASGGKLCAKGHFGVKMLYDPDRLKYPLKRTNPKKGFNQDPGWVKISWEEAYDIIASKVNEAIEKYGPQSIVNIGHRVFKNLMKAIGSPNIISHTSTCYATSLLTQRVLTGKTWCPDLFNSKYILSFGWDQAGKGKNVFARGFAEAKRKGAKIVVFDPRLSTTASLADLWIPIKPGTDLAVALAMINTIVNEELYDKEFIKENCYGFDKICRLVQKYTPEWAEEKSEVPAKTIESIARDFATIKPACIPVWKRGGGGPMRKNATRLTHAIIILMSITGNIGKRGGWIPRVIKLGRVSPVKTPPPPVTQNRIDGREYFPLANCGPYQSIPHQLLHDEPYHTEVIFFTRASLLSFMQPKLLGKALESKFVVNLNIYLDELSYFSDIMLPESTYLERSGVVPRTTYTLFPQVSVMQPVVGRLFDTRSAEEIEYEIAKRIEMRKIKVEATPEKPKPTQPSPVVEEAC